MSDKTEITKESLMEIWEDYCKNKASNPELFNTINTGTEILNTIRISDVISITVEESLPPEGSKGSSLYSLMLIFSDILRYKHFELSDSENDELITSFDEGIVSATKKAKLEMIDEGLLHFKQQLIHSKVPV